MKTLTDWYPGDGIVFICLEVLVMITVLAATMWAADRLFARRNASLRSVLWLSALCGVLLTPALALLGLQLPWRFAVLATQKPLSEPITASVATAIPTPTPILTHPLAAGDPGQQSAPSETTVPHQAAPFKSKFAADKFVDEVPITHSESSKPTTVIPKVSESRDEPSPPAWSGQHALANLGLLVWGLGTAYLLARALHGWYAVRRLWSSLRPLDARCCGMEISASSTLLHQVCVSAHVFSPVVVGLWSPRVVLPEKLLGRCSPEQLRHILVHECAHITRRDPWVNLLQCLAGALYWVNPLVAFLNQQLNMAREAVCDNYVLTHADAPAYAETLLTVAQFCYPTPRLKGYLTMIPRHFNLERRVAGLLDQSRDKSTQLPARQAVVVFAALVLTLVGVGSFGLHGIADGQNSPDKGTAAAPAAAKESQSPAKADNPLSQAEKLTGTVQAADGSPAAGAIVWAVKLTDGPLQRRETTADAGGRFKLNADTGTWYVWARRGTEGGYGPARHKSIDVKAGVVPLPMAIRLEERGTFRGRLLEAETGKPIVGGQFYLDEGIVLTTGPDGRFELGGFWRGNHEAFVVAPGRRRMRVLFDTTARADTELEVPVDRGTKIIGRVTDKDGKPLRDAVVGKHTSGSFFSINGLWTACDAEGRFEYDGCLPDMPTRLSAAAPGYVEEERSVVVGPNDAKPLEIHFRLKVNASKDLEQRLPVDEPRRTVSGTVRGPDMKPVADVVIRWGYQPFSDAIQSRTDSDGRFRLTVPNKANMLAVLPREFKPQFPRVSAGGDQTVDVDLEEGRTVQGKVLNEEGKPIKGVWVIAVAPSPEPRIGNPFWLSEASVHTDADGKFIIKGVPDQASLDFLKEGFSDLRHQVLDFSRKDHTVTLLHGGAIIGRVVDQQDKPIRNFRVLVGFPIERKPKDYSGGYFAGYSGIGVRFTSDDGTFVLTGVRTGSVLRITVVAEGHGEAVLDRVLAKPANLHAIAGVALFKTGPPVPLRVRVVSAGKPIAGARVTLVNRQALQDKSFRWGSDEVGWDDSVHGRIGAEGWVTFPALSFGGATLAVQAPGYGRHHSGWRDGQKELTIELAPEAVLTGEVHDAGGELLEQGYINLESDVGDQVSTKIGPDDKGKFNIRELPAGEWMLRVRGADGLATLHEERVTLKAGETKELKIRTRE